jgi:hypothetical protein
MVTPEKFKHSLFRKKIIECTLIASLVRPDVRRFARSFATARVLAGCSPPLCYPLRINDLRQKSALKKALMADDVPGGRDPKTL